MMFRPLLASFALAPLLLPAQQGDRPNDPQPPLPAHLQIPPAPALAPDEALRTFVVAPGYRVELVASEPLVADPIALTFGPDGRLWVLEMRGYMPDVDGEEEEAPVGTVAVLTDRDGDGRMDERQEFVGGLVLPRALALAGDGLLVGEPPRLWWFRDTDGDGRADTRTEVASDYGARGNPEHTANGLYRAMDNWIYNANHRTRWRQTGPGELERGPTVGRGQWGISQDDLGRLYYNNNSLPLQMDLLPPEYLARNPDLVSTTTAGRIIAGLADIRVWPARVTPGVNRGYKILDDDGKIHQVTAACAPLIYRSALLPPDVRGNAFIAEPAGNLVKRLRVEPVGNGDWRAVNVYEGHEFLASTDERFRPVNLHEGPDGALYVVDMYRGVIQHRKFVTSFLRKQIEERGLEAPTGLGRIYRIVPDRPARRPAPPALHATDTAGLVRALEHPHAWWRDTAQRLLVERADRAAVEPLAALARSGLPVSRRHALWTLHGLGALDRDVVVSLLEHPEPDLQALAVRLSEPWLRAGDEALWEQVVALARSRSPELRRQVALSVGERSGAAPLPVLTGLALTSGETFGMDEAIVSGLHRREVVFLRTLAAAASPNQAERTATLAVAAVLERSDAGEVAAVQTLAAEGAGTGIVAAALVGAMERATNALDPAPDARHPVLRWPVEPTALQALAQRDTPLGRRLATVLPWVKGPSDLASEPPLRPLTADEQQRFRTGEAAYAVCAGCHHPEGVGYTGVAPSLVGSRWASAPEDAIIRIVLHGKEGDALGMPPLGALDDETIAAVTTYVRRAWGSRGEPVTPAKVAEIRAAERARDQPWTAEELAAVVEAPAVDPEQAR